MTTKLVLLSGGIDSTVTLAMAHQESPNDVAAISFDYGQLHLRELACAEHICGHYKVQHIIQQVKGLEGSPLTSEDPSRVPDGKYEDFPGLSPTYVPFRNGLLLSTASAVAMALGFDEVWFGAHASDWGSWAYPDCGPDFIEHMGYAIFYGTNNLVRLKTPILYKTKPEVVSTGLDLNVPFEFTWSCYKGGDVQCGTCPTCEERRAAFTANDTIDPRGFANHGHNR